MSDLRPGSDDIAHLRQVVAQAGEVLFGEACIKLGFATESQIEEARREHSTGSGLSLAQILLKRNILSTEQFLKVLEIQDNDLLSCPGCGRTVLLQGPRRSDIIRCLHCSSEILVPVKEGASAAPLRQEPDHVGRFEIEREIAKGGMGVVYKARDPELGRPVALKVVRQGLSDPEYAVRLQREACAAAALRHPAIVTILEVGVSGGRHYVAMDFIDGPTLREALAEGKLDLRRGVEVLEQVASAIDFAHRHGIVHRDLKPANIMLDGGVRPIVTDFGLAQMTGDILHLTKSGTVMGTPFYMAPEQAQGRQERIGPPTDVYALGIILYEILTGRVPFQGTNEVQLFQKILAGDPPHPASLRPGVDPDLATIALKAIELEPGDRYTSAGAFAAELRRFLQGEPIQARPLPAWSRLGRRIRRHRLVSALIGAILLLGATGIYLGLRARSSQEAAQRSELQRREAERRQRDTIRDFETLADQAVKTLDNVELGPPRPLDKERAELSRTIGVLERIYADNPDAHEALIAIGKIQARLRRFDESEALFNRGLSRLGDRAGGRHFLERAMLHVMELGEAKLRALWYVNEETSKARQERMNRLAAAAKADLDEANRRGIEVTSQYGKYVLAAGAFAENDQVRCRTLCDELARDPDSPAPLRADALHLKALTFVYGGTSAEAARFYDEAAEIKRSDARILLGAAMSRMYTTGDEQLKGIRAAEQCTTVDAGDVDAWVLLGNLRRNVAQNRQGEEATRFYEAAIEAYRSGLDRDPKNAFARSLHASTRLDYLLLIGAPTAELETAVADAEQALALAPDHYVLRAPLAKARLSLAEQAGGNASDLARKAVADFESLKKAGMVGPDGDSQLGRACAVLGRALLESKDFPGAAEALKRAFELDPKLREKFGADYEEAKRNAGR